MSLSERVFVLKSHRSSFLHRWRVVLNLHPPPLPWRGRRDAPRPDAPLAFVSARTSSSSAACLLHDSEKLAAPRPSSCWRRYHAQPLHRPGAEEGARGCRSPGPQRRPDGDGTAARRIAAARHGATVRRHLDVGTQDDLALHLHARRADLSATRYTAHPHEDDQQAELRGGRGAGALRLLQPAAPDRRQPRLVRRHREYRGYPRRARRGCATHPRCSHPARTQLAPSARPALPAPVSSFSTASNVSTVSICVSTCAL